MGSSRKDQVNSRITLIIFVFAEDYSASTQSCFTGKAGNSLKSGVVNG